MKNAMKTLKIMIVAAMVVVGLSAVSSQQSAVSGQRSTIADGRYYGSNYTVPFAHAFRALGEVGADRKNAIDKDVYHFARLGLNAFRLHVWDVELTDSAGNLLDNEHLDLLDYLIFKLEQRGIAIVLTAQTNFGNGYPEHNSNENSAFSYLYEKCQIHDDPAAIAAQQTYLSALVQHINRYTGTSYAADSHILAIEVNNEPCHSGTPEEITEYVNTMVRTLRAAGWAKDILYNVSHNLWATAAFYKADIDGTTFQWYPTGLVSGHTREGNFLPMLDDYDIPFDTIPGFDRLSRVIYEYDPADVLATYLYPAAVRTFRKAGFDWVTQFAYDPMDIACYNTEYQTHYLNLAYTPGKAVGAAIAAEAMRRIDKGVDFGSYPADTIFGDFLVSASRDLAMLNDEQYFYHTNSTDVFPKAIERLSHIKAVGSSPFIFTDGTGAYFLDKVAQGVWRLEVMPDVVITRDPFAKPSLKRKVAQILYNDISMTIGLPDLGGDYRCLELSGGSEQRAESGSITIAPGVYVLSAADADISGFANSISTEYAAPERTDVPLTLLHKPQKYHSGEVTLAATVIGDMPPDSVVAYPRRLDFWSDRIEAFRLEKVGKYEYATSIPMRSDFEYRIVVYCGETRYTFPDRIAGAPTDYDFDSDNAPFFTSRYADPDEPLVLFDPAEDIAELSTIPDTWKGVRCAVVRQPLALPRLSIRKDAGIDPQLCVSATAQTAPTTATTVKILIGKHQGCKTLKIGLVSADGFTYSATSEITDGVATFDLADLVPDVTLLNPAPYPVFLSRQFVPEINSVPDFDISRLQTITVLVAPTSEEVSLEILGITIQ